MPFPKSRGGPFGNTTSRRLRPGNPSMALNPLSQEDEGALTRFHFHRHMTRPLCQ
jgi:hypothetical protein